MTTSVNISAIEAVEKAMEGGYWAASVYDCRPPRSRRDNPLKHSRIITLHGKFAAEAEALSAGADAIKNGWTGSCIIDRDTATHSATFELSRSSVSDLARAISAILAEARKAEALKREIAEKDARIAALEEALKPFAAAGAMAIISGNPPGNHVDASAYERAIEVIRARTLLNGGSDAQG